RLAIACIADPAIINDDLEKLAVAEHLTEPGGSAPHPNIAGVPGWFDDARNDLDHPASARQMLEKFGTQILERAEFIAGREGARSIDRILEFGDPASSLLDTAEREKAELIVIGTRGLGRIKEIQLGSVSHKVAMLAPCPCMIVK
ncbi:MAG: universal stress protein, partial [Pseudomonadota bacterium]